MKNGKLTHLGWAEQFIIKGIRNKGYKKNTPQCIGYYFPPKRVLRGGWANTFWETTHSEEHSPSDVWSCFPSKYQAYLPGVISVFWDFKQISSPTDNPQKIEKTCQRVNTWSAGIIYSAWWVWELVSYVRCWYTQCHQFWATVSKIFPYILKYFCPRLSHSAVCTLVDLSC